MKRELRIFVHYGGGCGKKGIQGEGCYKFSFE